MSKKITLLALAGVAFAIICCKAPANPEDLAAKSVYGPSGGLIQTGSYKSFVVEKGAGPETLVLIHGFASSSYTWHSIIDALSARYHVLALDLKGFGASGRPDGQYGNVEFAEQVIQVLDAFKVPKATLIGNSMGGRASAFLAIHSPKRVERLVLVDAGGYPKDGRESRPFAIKLLRLPGSTTILRAFISKSYVRSSLESAYFDPERVAPQTVDTYYEALTAKDAQLAPAGLAERGSAEDLPVEDIKTIKVPTLVLWGREDKWIPVSNAYRFQTDIERSTLFIIPDCGHVPQEEKPEITSQIILSFLRSAPVRR